MKTNGLFELGSQFALKIESRLKKEFTVETYWSKKDLKI